MELKLFDSERKVMEVLWDQFSFHKSNECLYT